MNTRAHDTGALVGKLASVDAISNGHNWRRPRLTERITFTVHRKLCVPCRYALFAHVGPQEDELSTLNLGRLRQELQSHEARLPRILLHRSAYILDPGDWTAVVASWKLNSSGSLVLLNFSGCVGQMDWAPQTVCWAPSNGL
jgi:hypothetical protein